MVSIFFLPFFLFLFLFFARGEGLSVSCQFHAAVFPVYCCMFIPPLALFISAWAAALIIGAGLRQSARGTVRHEA